MTAAPEFVLRLHSDKPDLHLLAGDALTVREQDTAEAGQIIVRPGEHDNAEVVRYDGTGQVMGVVIAMHRRIPGASS